jgi:hypothetical protein
VKMNETSAAEITEGIFKELENTTAPPKSKAEPAPASGLPTSSTQGDVVYDQDAWRKYHQGQAAASSQAAPSPAANAAEPASVADIQLMMQ